MAAVIGLYLGGLTWSRYESPADRAKRYADGPKRACRAMVEKFDANPVDMYKAGEEDRYNAIVREFWNSASDLDPDDPDARIIKDHIAADKTASRALYETGDIGVLDSLGPSGFLEAVDACSRFGFRELQDRLDAS